MSRIKRGRPSPAILIAVLALVAALAGTAVAGPGATTSKQHKLSKGQKKQTKKLAKKQVNKVLPLESEDIADGAVGGSQLGSINVRSGTPVVVSGGAAQNGAYVLGQATASCNAGEKLITGHGDWTDGPILGGGAPAEELFISEVVLSASTVTVAGGNDSGTARSLRANAVCLG